MRFSCRRIASFLLVFVGTALTTGCVSSSAYDRMQDTYKSKIEARNETIRNLKEQNKSLMEDVSDLKSKNKNLRAKLEIAESAQVSPKQEEIIAGEPGVSRGEEGQIIIEGDLLFDSGSWEIRDEAKDVLSELAGSINDQNITLKVAGHTDNEPIDNIAPQLKFDTNTELGALRALSVFEFLKQQGLDPANMYIASYGPQRPKAPNNSPENMAKNRRVEIWQYQGTGPGSTSGNTSSNQDPSKSSAPNKESAPEKGGK